MITEEQNKEITRYLSGRNLPLDLLLELEDHIKEQIDDSMNYQDKSFDSAFLETKQTWQKDLQMKTSFWASEKRTNIHIKTINETSNKFLVLSIKWFLPILLISILFLLYNKTLAYYFNLFVYIIAFLITISILITDYKTIKTSFFSYEKKISYLQKGVSILTISVIYLPAFNLLDYDNRFEKLYNAYWGLINLNFNFSNIFSLLTSYIYLWGVIYGLLYYFEYKKVINYLQKRINLKL